MTVTCNQHTIVNQNSSSKILKNPQRDNADRKETNRNGNDLLTDFGPITSSNSSNTDRRIDISRAMFHQLDYLLPPSELLSTFQQQTKKPKRISRSVYRLRSVSNGRKSAQKSQMAWNHKRVFQEPFRQQLDTTPPQLQT